MPPEQVEEIRAWLIKAARDLEAARRLIESEEPLLDIVVYHCQQSMEKALKGFLTFKESPFTKTHALVLLVEQAAEIDSSFDNLADHAEELSPFAWRFRYPGELLEPGRDEANNALELARTALEFVIERIPEEARP
jgi:HEPN domain-containing protein